MASEHGHGSDAVCRGGPSGAGRYGRGHDGERLIGLVVVGATVEERGDGPPQPDGVERLDHPPLGSGPPGQKDIRVAGPAA